MADISEWFNTLIGIETGPFWYKSGNAYKYKCIPSLTKHNFSVQNIHSYIKIYYKSHVRVILHLTYGEIDMLKNSTFGNFLLFIPGNRLNKLLIYVCFETP